MKDLLLDCKTALGLAKHMAEREGYDEGVYDNCIQKITEALRIHDVISRRELLLDFAEYSENDNTSTALDECVDNYLDSIKQ